MFTRFNLSTNTCDCDCGGGNGDLVSDLLPGVVLFCHLSHLPTVTMSSTVSLRPNRFKPTHVQTFPRGKRAAEGQDAKFWSALQFPVSVQEGAGQVSAVDVCQSRPHLVAVTGSAKVQVYDPAAAASAGAASESDAAASHEPVKTFSKFKERSHGARIRRDGKLLAAGGDDGAVRCLQNHCRSMLTVALFGVHFLQAV